MQLIIGEKKMLLKMIDSSVQMMVIDTEDKGKKMMELDRGRQGMSMMPRKKEKMMVLMNKIRRGEEKVGMALRAPD